MEQEKGKIVLIDGYSILNRAFYGIPLLTNSEGEHTNAVYGFLNILFKILEDEQPQYLAVAFDVKKPTFRHEMYADYKGTRKPMPEELTSQVPMLKEILRAMEIPCVEKAGLEADDILGTLAKKCEQEGVRVSLVSGDRDLLQLATDTVKVRIPKTKAGKTEIFDYYAKDVEALYGVTPTEFIDMKALMGDASDNIPGLPGVGEKTAGKLIATYKSIENCYAHRDEIKPARAQKAFEEQFELAVLSKKLATIETDAQLDFTLQDAKLNDIYTPQAYELIKKHNFKSMFDRFQETAKQVTSMPSVRRIEEYEEANRYVDGLLARLEKKKWLCGVQVLEQDRELYGIAFCESPDEAVFIPVRYFLDEDWVKNILYRLMKCGGCIFIDAKAHLYLLEGEKRFEAYTFYDVSLGAYLLNPLKSSYSYEEIASDYLEVTYPSMQELFGRQPLSFFALGQPETLEKAACLPAQTAFLAWSMIERKLQQTQMYDLYRDIELPLLSALYRMEQVGVLVKKDALKAYGDRLSVGIEALEKEIHQEAGTEFNINSPKQLGEILFERMHLKGGKKTKSGYSTAAEVLEKLAPENPIIRKILDYRQLTKLKSTYADGLAVFIQEDGRIHGRFNQTITATGRISSTEPNLQNIPVRMELGREIRKLFVPKEGCVLVDADYSQIELRILAHMSGDENLIDAYRQARDIHAVTASQVFHIPLEEVTPQIRRNAKAVNFGIVYGISAFGLSEDLSISRKEATDYIERYFKTYPKVKEFLDGLVETGKEKGYVTTMYCRRRPIPELKSSNYMQRAFGERVAMNSPIQGTAADIMKLAMLRVERALLDAGLQARIILQVHDELLLETPKEEVEAVKEILEKNMRDSFSLSIPLEIDVHVGDSWFETK